MDILIIEDEPHAAERLERLVRELVRDVTIVGRIDSVKKAVEWFTTHAAPDVVLLDIQLADGISFRITPNCLPAVNSASTVRPVTVPPGLDSDSA